MVGVTAKRAGQARNVSILSPVHSLWKRVRGSAEGTPTCPVMAEVHLKVTVFPKQKALLQIGVQFTHDLSEN